MNSMIEIAAIRGRELLDSNGFPALETEVRLIDGTVGRAMVPSGTSTGTHEAYELRDGEDRHAGKGVLKAVQNLDEIATILTNTVSLTQRDIDERMIELDGTPNKSRLGANAILGVSMAAARAAAQFANVSLYESLGDQEPRVLPVPMMNIINGGAHADNNLDFQEFMIVPVGASSFREARDLGAEVFHKLGDNLRARGFNTNVGKEGGYAPSLRSEREAIEEILIAIRSLGLQPLHDVAIAIDAAANELLIPPLFGTNRKYAVGTKTMDSDEMVEMWSDLVRDFPAIVSIEDALAENDWSSWELLSRELGGLVQLVGDDLFVTNPDRLQHGINKKAANSILIKPNQIGTVTETLDVIELARANGYTTVISHRSGETEDTFIADLAVATNAGQIKTGAPNRGERTAKYNQLSRIEEQLGSRAAYLGHAAFRHL